MSSAFRAGAALLIGWLALTIPLSLAESTADEQATRAQLKQLRQEMNELTQLLQNFRDERSALQGALRDSEVEIGEVQQRIRRIQQQLQRHQRELESLQQERSQLQGAKQQKSRQIAAQVRSAYRLGHQSRIKLLLNQQRPETVSRTLAYHDYFNRAHSRQLEAYIDLISELDQVEPALRQRRDQLALARGQLEQQRDTLEDARVRRRQNLARLEATIRDKDDELKTRAREQAELEALLEAMQETLANLSLPADYRPFDELKGKLPWPVKGRTLHRFGSPREGGSLRWQGTTIQAREGEEVLAVHHGRVVFADWFRGAGLLLILDHGGGYMSLYGHNQSLLRETGDWVAAGDPIATVGNSGGLRQAGLYFEIRHNGHPTDPGQWCRA